MKPLNFNYFVKQNLILISLLFSPEVNAQIAPDTTLTSPSQITINTNTITINNGTIVGGNLFHSFESFSIPEGIEAWFNNDLTIDNIITRVTGNNISNIEGILRTNGEANLFFLNPNGITFGANAQIDIGGSFIASSADSIEFSDGTQFSVTNPTEPSLLTINVPLGLQYGSNPGTIINQSQSIAANGQTVGLQVPSGQTLGLIGGNLVLEGGYLTTPQGRVELGSVTDNGLVGLTFPDSGGILLNYDQVANFGDIQLSQGAVVNTNGEGGGNVQLQGKQILIEDRSYISNSTLGNQNGGQITLRGSEKVEIIGTGFAEFQQTFIVQGLAGTITPLTTGTGLFSETQGTGSAGEISIKTPHLSLQEGAVFLTPTFGEGQGGNITINAFEQIEAKGSGIITSTTIGSSGDAGDLRIETGQLQVENGGVFITTTLGSGHGGNIDVVASESVQLLTTLPENLLQTGIFTSSIFGTGTSGDIHLETKTLILQDGALLSTQSGVDLRDLFIPVGGAGGNLTIHASELIEVSGISTDGVLPSSITAETQTNAPAGNVTLETGILRVQEGANLSVSTFGNGDGGNLTIDTRQLIIRDNATVSSGSGLSTENGIFPTLGDGGNILILASENVLLTNTANNQVSASLRTDSFNLGNSGNLTLITPELVLEGNSQLTVSGLGTGNSGTLEVIADSIQLNNTARLTAISTSGEGGNINLQLQGNLQLRNNSLISAQAQGTGNGGNINIVAQFALAIPTENSDIIANAFEGRGGNITITTQGLFGLQLQDQLTDFSDISVSSDLGVDGVVTLNTPDANTGIDLILLPTEFIEASTIVVQGCSAQGNAMGIGTSELNVIGRGGLPPNPGIFVESFTILEDLGTPSLAMSRNKISVPSIPSPASVTTPIVEAQGWIIDAQGNIILTAEPVTAIPQSPWSPSYSC